VSQATYERVSHHTLRTTLSAELITVNRQHAAVQHSTLACDVLTDDEQAKIIQPTKRGQVRGNEGNVVHVEVFLDGLLRNSHHRKTSTPTLAATRRTTPQRQELAALKQWARQHQPHRPLQASQAKPRDQQHGRARRARQGDQP
jgi:hypothetical protein